MRWVVLGVHVDVHVGEWVILWVAAMYNVLALLSMADMVCHACMHAETVESMSSASWICMVCMVCIVHTYMVCLIIEV